LQGCANRPAALAAALLVAGLGGPPPALAEEPAAASGVPLDRLLKLPPSLPAQGEVEKRGGATRDEWQARFSAAREQLERARKELEGARADLQGRVDEDGSSWKMAAPGLGTSAKPPSEAGPIDYKLSQDLRRGREDVERAEKRLQDLEVEANLAGVPAEWRGAEDGSAAAPESAAKGPGS
jgi:hypothetical protein